VFIAERLVGPSKQLKQIIQIEEDIFWESQLARGKPEGADPGILISPPQSEKSVGCFQGMAYKLIREFETTEYPAIPKHR